MTFEKINLKTMISCFAAVIACLFILNPDTFARTADDDLVLNPMGEEYSITNKFLENLENPNFIRVLVSDLIKKPNLSTKQRYELEHCKEILEYVHFWNERLAFIKLQQTKMEKVIAGRKPGDMIESLQKMQSELPDWNFAEKLRNFKQGLAQRPEAGFFGISTNLSNLKNELIAVNRKYSEYQAELERLYSGTVIRTAGQRTLKLQNKNQNVLESKKQLENLEEHVKEIRMQLVQKDVQLQESENKYLNLQTEMQSLQSQISSLTNSAENNEDFIAEFKKDLADLSLEIFEKDQLVAAKDSQLQDLQRELMEVNQRLSLIQRIIQEKDQHIAGLEGELTRMKQDYAGKFGANEGLSAELLDQLGDIQKELNEQKEQSRKQLAELKNLISQRDKDIQLLQNNLYEKDELIVKLKSHVYFNNKRLAELDSLFALKKSELNESAGILGIYQKRLAETHHALEEKIKQFTILEEKVQSLENELQKITTQDTLSRYKNLNAPDVTSAGFRNVYFPNMK